MQANKKSSFEPEADMAAVLESIEKGDTKPQTVARTGLSRSTVNQTIKELNEEKGLLIHYREVQSLQLTKLQQKVLGYMDDEDKMERSSLVELASVFGILKKNELTLDGKPSEIKGLITYLVAIEEEELEAKTLPVEGSIIDVSEEDPEVEEAVPNL